MVPITKMADYNTNLNAINVLSTQRNILRFLGTEKTVYMCSLWKPSNRRVVLSHIRIY